MFLENSCFYYLKLKREIPQDFSKILAKKPVKQFLFSKAAGLQPSNLLITELNHGYFSRILHRFSGHIFSRTSFFGSCEKKADEKPHKTLQYKQISTIRDF